jgi:hypothetical protein
MFRYFSQSDDEVSLDDEDITTNVSKYAENNSEVLTLDHARFIG